MGYRCQPPLLSLEDVVDIATHAIGTLNWQRGLYPEHPWEVVEARLRMDVRAVQDILAKAESSMVLPEIRSLKEICDSDDGKNLTTLLRQPSLQRGPNPLGFHHLVDLGS